MCADLVHVAVYVSPNHHSLGLLQPIFHVIPSSTQAVHRPELRTWFDVAERRTSSLGPLNHAPSKFER